MNRWEWFGKETVKGLIFGLILFITCYLLGLEWSWKIFALVFISVVASGTLDRMCPTDVTQ